MIWLHHIDSSAYTCYAKDIPSRNEAEYALTNSKNKIDVTRRDKRKEDTFRTPRRVGIIIIQELFTLRNDLLYTYVYTQYNVSIYHIYCLLIYLLWSENLWLTLSPFPVSLLFSSYGHFILPLFNLAFHQFHQFHQFQPRQFSIQWA